MGHFAASRPHQVLHRMDLKSIFQRKPGRSAAPSAEAPTDQVQQARLRARRRLIGAVVLVVIGVIGFPLLFETQPRPIPVDIPIIIPRRDTAPALVMPAPRPSRQAAAASASSSGAAETVETAEAEREVPAPKAAQSLSERGDAAPRTVPTPSTAAASAPPGASFDKPAVAVNPSGGEPKRSQAVPDAKATDKTAAERGGRYVVQVGAFADSASARELRQKVEKLGLKTYTQVADTAHGHRVRVRVGPFATREEADRALAKIKASGAPAVVITL